MRWPSCWPVRHPSQRRSRPAAFSSASTTTRARPCPASTITISSAALVAGQTTGVSDAGGAYRFPSLPPGVYTVKVELQGFQTVTRENVNVLVGQTTPIDLTMKVATLAETVTVTGTSPVIDTTSANVAVNLSEQLLQGTPGGRDIWALVEYKVPSLLITRPDVGRHVRRPAGHLQRARHDERAELAVPQRRQRRRPGRHRRRRLLLRLRRLRGHPGLDRRARHHRADERRVPEHGDQERRRQLVRTRHVHLARRRHAEPEHRRRPAALRVPPRDQLRRLRVRHQRQRRRAAHRATSCACSDRSATGACTSTCPRRSRRWCSTRPTSRRT